MQIVTKKLLFTFSLIITIFSYNNVLAATSCSVSITAPVNFGTINPYDYIPETTLGEAKVACTTGKGNLNYTLSFSIVGNTRSILYKINSLSYNLYKDSAYTQILGDGNNGTLVITKNYANPPNIVSDTYTIYGKVPIQPVAVEGNYSANVLVTLSY